MECKKSITVKCIVPRTNVPLVDTVVDRHQFCLTFLEDYYGKGKIETLQNCKFISEPKNDGELRSIEQT